MTQRKTSPSDLQTSAQLPTVSGTSLMSRLRAFNIGEEWWSQSRIATEPTHQLLGATFECCGFLPLLHESVVVYYLCRVLYGALSCVLETSLLPARRGRTLQGWGWRPHKHHALRKDRVRVIIHWNLFWLSAICLLSCSNSDQVFPFCQPSE